MGDYVFVNEKIPRPFFTRLCASDRTQVTRNHPPVAGVDALDHGTMHPGLCLAFGDLNGVDFWRNRGRIKHFRFTKEPVVTEGRLKFAVEEQYLAPNGTEVCRGNNVFCFVDGKTLQPPQSGTLLMWNTTLKSDDRPLEFGPQHEMGLAFRVETSIVVKNGNGRITGSHGGQNESGNWARTAEWWDYSAAIDGQRKGILAVVAHDNARKFWSHSRDYGFLAINPTGPPPNRKDVPSIGFTVPKGKPFEMTFGVLMYSTTIEHASADDDNAKEVAASAQAVQTVLKLWKRDPSQQ